MDTGYFGIPGRDGRKVHAVDNGKPICGTVIDSRAKFQWCAPSVIFAWIECARCKNKLRRSNGIL